MMQPLNVELLPEIPDFVWVACETWGCPAVETIDEIWREMRPLLEKMAYDFQDETMVDDLVIVFGESHIAEIIYKIARPSSKEEMKVWWNVVFSMLARQQEFNIVKLFR